MYTIQREVGHLNKLKIGLVGDLANGRTVRSLAYLLSMYDNVKMYFVAPDVVRMKDDIKEFLSGRSALESHCTLCLCTVGMLFFLHSCPVVCCHLQPGINTMANRCPNQSRRVVTDAFAFTAQITSRLIVEDASVFISNKTAKHKMWMQRSGLAGS